MTDRPIIFSGPMVRALLDGRKTQTRRILKPQPEVAILASEHLEDHELRGWECYEQTDGRYAVVKRMPYAPGDRLWVRENFWPAFKRTETETGAVYRADYIKPTQLDPSVYHQKCWTPSIHMPRWASRLTLIVEGVKVERLLDINETDAQAEGVDPVIDHGVGNPNRHATAFLQLWDHLHGSGATYANPWVVAVTFRVVKANIDSLEARAA